MEGSSSKPSGQDQTAGGVSSLLAGLPSRGLFSSTFPSSSLGGMRVYICEHDTAPPEDQQIKTNQQNILIRSLTLRKQKTESSSKAAAASDGSRKRYLTGLLCQMLRRLWMAGAPPKEPIVAVVLDKDHREIEKTVLVTAAAGGVTSFPADYNFQSLTVERLRALLKERGLSVKGKKDELIARLRAANT